MFVYDEINKLDPVPKTPLSIQIYPLLAVLLYSPLNFNINIDGGERGDIR